MVENQSMREREERERAVVRTDWVSYMCYLELVVYMYKERLGAVER